MSDRFGKDVSGGLASTWIAALSLCIGLAISGCEAPEGGRLRSLLPVSQSDNAQTDNSQTDRIDQPDENSESACRREYQSTRSRKAMRWLMAHRLRSGMSHEEVGHVLGEDGERELNDKWVKTNAGFYRMDDIVYKFGPDAEGSSVYLVFRDDRLVNYEPGDYASTSGTPSVGPSRSGAKRAASKDADFE